MTILAEAPPDTRMTYPLGRDGTLTHHQGESANVTVEQSNGGTERVILWRDGAEFVLSPDEALTCAFELAAAYAMLRGGAAIPLL